ncbi:MAG: small, acid-soluble spore protein, H family [Clostridia bacterium]
MKEIYYNEQPVWIQEVHGDKATVGFLNSNNTEDLYINDLYEKNLYN